jgi:MoaA/NifB/PqqE/SkfB family radical SAM enzyme
MVKCVVPWTQMEICATGYVRPCAEYQHDLTDQHGNKLDVNNPQHSIKDIWNNHEYVKLREHFLKGQWPAGCKKCFKQEEQGITSRRQYELDINGHHLENCTSAHADNPKLLDIKLSSLCNLKCRICNSEFSHNWIKDEQDVYGLVLNKNAGRNWVDHDENWSDIKEIVDNLETLYLSGGEPFLIEKHFELLDYIIETDVAKNIRIKFATNGTIKLRDKILDRLKHFKDVTVMYSIDDIGKRYEYQRPPAHWEVVENNFLDALQHDFLDVVITRTVGLLNSTSGSDFVQWCDKNNFSLDKVFLNYVREPIYYDLSMLDKTQKEYINSLLGDNRIDNEVRKYMRSQHEDNVSDTAWGVNSHKDLDNLRKYVIMSLDKKSKLSLEDVSQDIARLVDGRYLDNQ